MPGFVIVAVVAAIGIALTLLLNRRAKRRNKAALAGQPVWVSVKVRGNTTPYPVKKARAALSREADGSIRISRIRPTNRSIVIRGELEVTRILVASNGYRNDGSSFLISALDPESNRVELLIASRNLSTVLTLLNVDDTGKPLSHKAPAAIPTTDEVTPANVRRPRVRARTVRGIALGLLILPAIVVGLLTVGALTSRSVTVTVTKNLGDGSCDGTYVSAWTGKSGTTNVSCADSTKPGDVLASDEVRWFGTGSFADAGDITIYAIITTILASAAAIPALGVWLYSRRVGRIEAEGDVKTVSYVGRGAQQSPSPIDDEPTATDTTEPTGVALFRQVAAESDRNGWSNPPFSIAQQLVQHRAERERWRDPAFQPQVKRAFSERMKRWRPPLGWKLYRAQLVFYLGLVVLVVPVVLAFVPASTLIGLSSGPTATTHATVETDNCGRLFLYLDTWVDFRVDGKPQSAQVIVSTCALPEKVKVEYSVAKPTNARVVSYDGLTQAVIASVALVVTALIVLLVVLMYTLRKPRAITRLQRRASQVERYRYVVAPSGFDADWMFFYAIDGDGPALFWVPLLENVTAMAEPSGVVVVRSNAEPADGVNILPAQDDVIFWPVGSARDATKSDVGGILTDVDDVTGFWTKPVTN